MNGFKGKLQQFGAGKVPAGSSAMIIVLITSQMTFAQSAIPIPHHRPPPPIVHPTETEVQKLDQSADNGIDAFEACLSKLAKQGVEFSRQEPFENEAECKIADPVKIISVPGISGAITLKAQPQLNCHFALRLAAWLSDVSVPIAESLAKSPMKSITSGPGFVCRHRYNDNAKKISEHAFGNAIDITGFRFANGKSIAVAAVLNGSKEEKKMLSALRMTSCGYFTTVLGPGTNPAHKSHFHLDHGKHGRTWNYRICE